MLCHFLKIDLGGGNFPQDGFGIGAAMPAFRDSGWKAGTDDVSRIAVDVGMGDSKMWHGEPAAQILNLVVVG